MTTQHTVPATGAPVDRAAARPRSALRNGPLKALSFRNASAVWVLALIMLVFSFTIPDTFLAQRTWTSLLDAQVVVAITAIALVVPMAAGVFNLAVGIQVGTASILLGYLLVEVGLPILPAVLLTILASAAIGLVIGIVIVWFRIESFIATLGVSSLLVALITIISGGRQILGMPRPLVDFAASRVLGVTYPFIVMLVLAAVVWFFLERTPMGRHVYAVGGNKEAARLSGVPTGAVVIGTLVVSGVLVGIAGCILTARLGNADPTIGSGYLLPVFTAALLGSTQFRGGRFNIWGTVLAVYVLAIGIKGLQLSGAPVWISDAFNGAALLVAVGLATSARLGKRRPSARRARRAADS